MSETLGVLSAYAQGGKCSQKTREIILVTVTVVDSSEV